MDYDTNYVSESELNDTIIIFQNKIHNISLQMENLSDFLNTSSGQIEQLEFYNGQEVEGSDSWTYNKETDTTSHSKEKFRMINTDEALQLNHSIDSEVSEVLNNTITLYSDATNMSTSAEIIAIYIKKVELELQAEGIENPSLNKIYSRLPQAIEDDKQKDYEWLYSTPILKNGKVNIYNGTYSNNKYEGEYLQFYNNNEIPTIAILKKVSYNENEEPSYISFDTEEEKNNFITKTREAYMHIKKNEKRYTEFYKDTTTKNLEKITFLYGENNIWAGRTHSSQSDKSTIAIDIGSYSAGANANQVVDIYTHELGHVFDNALAKKLETNTISYSEQSSYLNIVEQINSEDPSNTYLRPYALNNSKETFAESCGEYYGNYDSNYLKEVDPLQYDPRDLEKIDIIASEENKFSGTYYDYMNQIMNGNFDMLL